MSARTAYPEPLRMLTFPCSYPAHKVISLLGFCLFMWRYKYYLFELCLGLLVLSACALMALEYLLTKCSAELHLASSPSLVSTPADCARRLKEVLEPYVGQVMRLTLLLFTELQETERQTLMDELQADLRSCFFERSVRDNLMMLLGQKLDAPVVVDTAVVADSAVVVKEVAVAPREARQDLVPLAPQGLPCQGLLNAILAQKLTQQLGCTLHLGAAQPAFSFLAKELRRLRAQPPKRVVLRPAWLLLVTTLRVYDWLALRGKDLHLQLPDD